MNTMKQLITRFTIVGLIVTLFQVNFALGGLSSLFNRQRLFQRTPVQQTNQNQQQQQQQPLQQSHQVQQQQDHLIFAANSLSPNHFNPFNIRHDDLLRLNAAQKNAVKHQQILNHQQEFGAFNGVEPATHITGFEQATQPATYYSGQPSQHQIGSLEDQSAMLGHQHSASSHFVQPLISYQKQQVVSQDPRTSSDGYKQHQQQHFISNLDHSGGQIPAAIIEPSQTEIVDKIERHIGRQIEQGLKDSSASGSEQRAASGEKESSASEGGESGEPEEGVEEPKVEKRHEGHKSEPEEHHEENPPEAFEVHHKKGGKSFQYFHQGHHK